MQLGINGKKLKGIFAGGLSGWILDSYDLSAMFLLVPVIATLFFPAGDLILAIIGAFAIYFISLVKESLFCPCILYLHFLSL